MESVLSDRFLTDLEGLHSAILDVAKLLWARFHNTCATELLWKFAASAFSLEATIAGDPAPHLLATGIVVLVNPLLVVEVVLTLSQRMIASATRHMHVIHIYTRDMSLLRCFSDVPRKRDDSTGDPVITCNFKNG